MPTPHQFYGFFASEMLDVEADHQHPIQPTRHFLLQGFLLVGIVAVAQHSCGLPFLLFILNDMYSAEGDHTAEECGVLLWMHLILLYDTERSLVASPYGIHLMPAQCAVEIQFAIGIDITDGDGIGVAIVAKQRQSARSGFPQYLYALVLRQLLALAPHCSKLFHFYDNVFSPMIDPMSVVRKNNLQNVAGSLKTNIPTTTAPTAPMPVHTG